jgi:four helix bundle protein
MKKRIFDLEDRLIDFAIKAVAIAEKLPQTKLGNHLAGQLVRSSTSTALNYGEAQAAESPNDFIHKMKVILKELREAKVCFKIIIKKPLLPSIEVENTLQENNELIAIFLKSIETAKRNRITSNK